MPRDVTDFLMTFVMVAVCVAIIWRVPSVRAAVVGQ